MTKLIINADDFGYSKGVNLGIMEAHINGAVSSSTLMANMRAAEHAASLAKQAPGLGVGIHLVLSCGRPICENVPSLVDGKGNFHHVKKLESFADEDDIEHEWIQQIERVLAFGITPTHLDSHHHVHGLRKVYPVMERLALKYGLPIRNINGEKKDIQPIQHFCTEFYGEHLTVENTIELLDRLRNYKVVELMTHPAYIDEPLLNGSSYVLPRVKELSILTSNELREALEKKGIQLMTYRDATVQYR